MRKIFVVTIVFVMSSMLIGCATSSLKIEEPHAITPEKIDMLKVAGATKDKVNSLFGDPEMKVPASDGMAYFYKDLSLNSLWVIFNADGTILKFKWSE